MVIREVRHRQIYHPAKSPGHAAWVSLWKTHDNRLMLSCQEIEGDRSAAPSYDFGKKRYRRNYSIRQLFLASDDSGATWKLEDKRDLPVPWLGFYPAKEALPSGEHLAVCRGQNLKGFSRGSVVLLRSRDGEMPWNIGGTLSYHCGCNIYANQIKRLSDGNIIIPVYDDTGNCLYFLSRDAGKTWSEPITIASGTEHISFWEPVLEEVEEGSLVCIMRTHWEDRGRKIRNNGINYRKVVLRKKNGIYEPDMPADTGFGFRGRPELLKTSAGILILAAPGHFFAFSSNDGASWEMRMDLMDDLPQNAVPSLMGIEDPVARYYQTLNVMHNADPNLIELDDGRILCAYFFGSDNPFPPPLDQYIGCTSFRIEP